MTSMKFLAIYCDSSNGVVRCSFDEATYDNLFKDWNSKQIALH